MIIKIFLGVVLFKLDELLIYDCGGGVSIMLFVGYGIGFDSFIIGYILFVLGVEILFYSYNC